MKITFIQTGGTFDKDYPVGKAYEFVIGDSAVPTVLTPVNPAFEFEVVTLLKKDSSDIRKPDRDKIVQACRSCKNDRIIVTHGTDTMIKTAKAIQGIENKRIVLTGSTKPQRFKETDADFNLGFAIAAVQLIKPGVYVAMNGQVHHWSRCLKNMETGQFVKHIPDPPFK